jgi:DNA (cytosine-5)-methyltransferase 1
LNYLSVCSGIEAATVAWHDLGWKPAGFSEIEKFPSQVLAHHYPDVTNFGDMTKYKEWNINDPIGLLVGGTPCQSFSVAGLRKGLEDPRGNLALTYVGILDRFRPKWCVWENVPGVLSSGGGRDFGSFLGALAELGYGWAYRVLDAQNFGVAQRRRRVFVVGHFGDWKPSAKVLFESESLSGNITQSRKAPEETAKCLTTRIRNDFETESFITHVAKKCPTILSSGAGFSRPGNTVTEHETYIAINNKFVRRLTEIECERLQGFPDNYTNIKENCPSGARYKALGNSMAVPVMRWIGQRIDGYQQRGMEKHLRS